MPSKDFIALLKEKTNGCQYIFDSVERVETDTVVAQVADREQEKKMSLTAKQLPRKKFDSYSYEKNFLTIKQNDLLVP